jgi:hypothetical protein
MSRAFLFLAILLATTQARAQDQEQLSAHELNKQLNNPVSSVWSIQFQNNLTSVKNDGPPLPGWQSNETEWFYNLNFQPVLPVKLTDRWNLISRTLIPVFGDRPVFTNGRFSDHSGIGDAVFLSLLSPAKVRGGLLWGVGPTFIFPTANIDELGQQKWQAGPAAVALHMSDRWVIGTLAQHWWSYAGDHEDPETSQSNIQYFIQRLLPNQWQVGMGPNVTIDWKADHENAVTFPVGLGVGKLVFFGKLPVRFQAEAQYAVINPADVGQRWNLRFVVTPVVPPLVRKPIFE